MSRPNFTQLSYFTYVCWTQAGFKRACAQVRENFSDPINGYPTVYPSVVTFHSQYAGHHYYDVQSIPLNEEINRALAYHKRLVDLDTEHRSIE